MAQDNDATDDRFPDVRLTDVGVVSHLREAYGIQATTAIQSESPGNPNEQVATIAVQQAVNTPASGDEWREFLEDQEFEKVENIGRGLFAWER